MAIKFRSRDQNLVTHNLASEFLKNMAPALEENAPRQSKFADLQLLGKIGIMPHAKYNQSNQV